MKYYVFSNYINARAIAKALKGLKKNLHFISTQKLNEAYTKKIQEGDVLFFTEENSLKFFQNCPQFHFYPKNLPIEIDDKYRFAQFLLEQGESPLPQHSVENFLKIPQMEYPVCLKPRHSWKKNRKSFPGAICRTHEELDSTIKILKVLKQDPLKTYFIQKYLSLKPKDGYSTCGFFDHSHPSRNAIITTQRLLNKKSGLSTAAIVQTVQDPANLIARTDMILSALNYTGPFEMEFLYDPAARHFYMLELNMRFWMQHEIFIQGYDNCIVKKYLNLDSEEEKTEGELPYKPILWINSIERIKSFLTCNFPRYQKFSQILKKASRAGYHIIQ